MLSLMLLTSSALAVVRSPLPAQECRGDCNLDGQVTIEELITAVDIALGFVSIDACRSADADGNDRIAVWELIVAVNGSLEECIPHL